MKCATTASFFVPLLSLSHVYSCMYKLTLSYIKCGLTHLFYFSLSSYSVRIESMLLKEEFPGACEVMTRDITILRCATKGNNCTLSSVQEHCSLRGALHAK